MVSDVFERMEGFFKRLETYTEVKMTEAMRDIIVKIMVEVLGIFGVVTKEIKQNSASKLIPDEYDCVADKPSEKFVKKLIGRRDIEDALNRLDKLTREEFQTVIAQVLKVTHDIGEKVDGVDGKVDDIDIKVQGIDDKVDVAIEGMFPI